MPPLLCDHPCAVAALDADGHACWEDAQQGRWGAACGKEGAAVQAAIHEAPPPSSQTRCPCTLQHHTAVISWEQAMCHTVSTETPCMRACTEGALTVLRVCSFVPATSLSASVELGPSLWHISGPLFHMRAPVSSCLRAHQDTHLHAYIQVCIPAHSSSMTSVFAFLLALNVMPPIDHASSVSCCLFCATRRVPFTQ